MFCRKYNIPKYETTDNERTEMIMNVKYGKGGCQTATVPDENLIGTFYPADVKCRPADEVIN